jgi:hypothetical protein
LNLSPNQIRANARKFSLEWKNESRERAESQTFWNEFFAVFGINRRHVGIFEAAFKKLSGNQGFIDVFWPKVLVCEQKSRGEDLDKAVDQAIGYLQAIAKVSADDLPRYVIVCDFERLRLHDIETSQHKEILVADLAINIEMFGFISGYLTQIRQKEETANINAAERMGVLHDQLEANGYEGHELKVMLIRLLFCLFAEDTGIFEKCQLENFIRQRTREDGSDLAALISQLFETLNKPTEKRLKNLDEQLKDFAYINGDLFLEHISTAAFDAEMRQVLLDACAMDWSQISPEIFGALFQSVMDKTERRNLGAHYTSEENILKVIKSLFLDDLKLEFESLKARGKGKARTTALDTFHQKLATLTFLDPACGCGNFLIVAYRELRLLELDVIEQLHKKGQLLEVDTVVRCNVNQFSGIEIEEFPSQIARVAMWLVDHQMNLLVSEHFGVHFARIPLVKSADIHHANALQLDWPVTDFILGNPPFLGKNFQSKEQKADLLNVCHDVSSAASLDFVAGWYALAAKMAGVNNYTRAAFVSTNSITQGEQVPILWSWMLTQGIHIQFAHRTFQWQSAARGKAAVHCVIIGFGKDDSVKKTIFEYEDIRGLPSSNIAKNINPYLVDAENIIVTKRSKPICKALIMTRGSQATDGGNLLLTEQEKDIVIKAEPLVSEWIKPFSMGDEFINNIPRFCLWLVDCPPTQLRKMPKILERLNLVKEMRLNSTKAATREWADRPMLFTESRQPNTAYLAIPRVSSERRNFIPIGFLPASHIAGDKLQIIPNATLYEFGILNSIMHNAWMRTVTGRLKSDYQYSVGIVYNNFPWPLNPTDKQKQAIKTAGQAILDARAAHPESSLADLYDPLSMPANLTKAHQTLDKAVEAAYGRRNFSNEAERVAFLFELYKQYTMCR